MKRRAAFAIAAVLSAVASILVVPRLASQDMPSDADVIREQLPSYPLKTCVVGGEELGKMGPPVNRVIEGRLVRFCCDNCENEFKKDPAKYLAKIDEAAKAAGKGSGHADHKTPPAAAPHAAHAAPAPPKAAPPPKGAGKPKLYCPMHPQFTSDRPGECPVCHMALEPIPDDVDSGRSEVAGHATITIRPERQQLIGLKWGTVEKRRVNRTIRAAARVDYNERSLAVVSLKFAGWIEALHVNAVGDAVRAGQPLLEVYSPEAFEALRNHHTAAAAARTLAPGAPPDARAFAEQTLASSRERLRLLDLTDAQIDALDPAAPPSPRVSVLARADGVVVRRNATRGAYVAPGEVLLETADLSTVWVNADVFEHEASAVSVGAEVSLHLQALPGESLNGRVIYVHPFLNEQTRTVRVRLEVPNSDGRLKPGMLAEAAISVDLGERVVVDDGAIFDTGRRQIVFVDDGNDRIRPREVVAGERLEGEAIVARGLEGGERVVTSATFLVDSESQIRAALLQSASGGDAPPPGHPGH